MESNQTAAREARRFLNAHVRDDWDWSDATGEPVAETTAIIEWRERVYSSSDDGSVSDGGGEDLVEEGYTQNGAITTNGNHQRHGSDPYKFDSPDDFGVVRDVEADKAAARAGKRKRELRREMCHNEGLAHFVRRRDTWSGARIKRRKQDGDEPEMDAGHIASSFTNGNVSSTTGSGSSASNPINLTPPASSDGIPGVAVNPSNGTSLMSTTAISSIEDPSSYPLDPIVPVHSAVLRHNPIRCSINAKAYPEIYAKIVVSPRSPSVPINLADMTRALVEGWKEDGEWPPKTGPLDPLAGGRKKKKAKSGTAVAAGDGASVLSIKEKMSKEDFLANHPHVKKGVESVRRVFRLSGGSHSGTGSGTHVDELGKSVGDGHG